jgi:hypothetical protein
MEAIQEMDEELIVERELNSLLEMTFRMEHELQVILKSRE